MAGQKKMWPVQVSSRLDAPKLGAMNFLNEISSRFPKAISFAAGRPREANFDVAGSLDYIKDFAAHKNPAGSAQAFNFLGQYGRTNGLICDLISKLLLTDDGISIQHDDIVVTSGCQEAMCLCVAAMCANPGDVALVADPAYVGMWGAVHVLGGEVQGVPSGPSGINLDSLEEKIEELKAEGKSVRILYVCPDHANPTGATMPMRNRQRLLRIAAEYKIHIIEDQTYGYFGYGKRLPSLKAMAGSASVIYLGSFSKTIYPGLRIGFMTADQVIEGTLPEIRLSDVVSKIKSFLTVNSCQLSQAIVGGLLVKHHCSLKAFVAPRVKEMKKNRDAMVSALQEYFPRDEPWTSGIGWNSPTGGYFLTLKVPFEVSEKDLLGVAPEKRTP